MFFKTYTVSALILLGVVCAFSLMTVIIILDDTQRIYHAVFLIVVLGVITYGWRLAKQYQKALFQSEQRYLAVVSALSEGIVLQEKDGSIQACNASAERILGLTAEQMMGRTSVDPRWRSVHEDGSPFPGETHPAMVALHTGEPKVGVVMGVHHPRGELRWILINSQPLRRDGESEPYAVVTSFTDITSRKRMIEALENQYDALRQSEQNHRALLQAIPDLVFRNHRDGTYLDYHAKNETDLLTSPSVFLGRRIPDILPEPLASEFMRFITQTLETNREQIYNYEALIRDKVCAFEARMVVAGEDEVLTIVRDITELKQARQREFELALEKERVRLLHQFIENASHEFRTPLSVINSSAFIMVRSDDMNRRQEKADMIDHQIKRIARLVDMLLLMSQIEGEISIETTLVDMKQVVERASQEVRVVRGDFPCLKLNIQPNLPPIKGTASYLVTALIQILDNAYRFTPKDGQIDVSLRLEANFVCCEIEDTGQGISQDSLPHIFETFWRQDSAHSTPGFGLGLPIAQRILSHYGGTIEVKSTLGVGSTFCLKFPVASNNAEIRLI